MGLEFLTLNIQWHVKKNIYEVSGDVNRQAQEEIVETFLRRQIGAGRDKSPVDKRDIYDMSLKWYPSDDRIEVSSNTGNKSLRDGILVGFLKYLWKN